MHLPFLEGFMGPAWSWVDTFHNNHVEDRIVMLGKSRSMIEFGGPCPGVYHQILRISDPYKVSFPRWTGSPRKDGQLMIKNNRIFPTACFNQTPHEMVGGYLLWHVHGSRFFGSPWKKAIPDFSLVRGSARSNYLVSIKRPKSPITFLGLYSTYLCGQMRLQVCHV